jgi:hypothetical protein
MNSNEFDYYIYKIDVPLDRQIYWFNKQLYDPLYRPFVRQLKMSIDILAGQFTEDTDNGYI